MRQNPPVQTKPPGTTTSSKATITGGLPSDGARSRKRPLSMLALLLAVVGFFSAASAINATGASAQTGPNDHVVAPNGDDTGPGTDARPWQTLTHAMRQLQPGDTLYVRAGIYRNQMAFVNTRGTPSNWIRVRNYPGERPSIVGQDGVSAEGHKIWGAIHLVEPAAYLDFRGFNIRGWGDTVDVAGVQTWRAHHINIGNSQIHWFGGGGINATESEYIRVIGNNIHHNAHTSWRATSGVSLYKAAELGGPARYYTNEIRNNFIWANENRRTGPDGLFTDGNCIVIDRFNETAASIAARDTPGYDTTEPDRFDEPDYYEGRTAITNNICAGNGGRGIHIFRTDNVDVIHNTLYHNAHTPGLTGEGELSTFVADNVRFINNVAQPLPGKRATLPWVSTNISFDRNVYVVPGGAQPWQISNAIGDQVVNSGGFIRPAVDARANFRLQATSPVINTGRSTTVRWDRGFRLRTGTVEAGAYDYRAAN